MIAVQRAGEAAPPRTAGEWGALLRGLTPEFSDDKPWQLIVDDPTQPAFMQCPAPNALGQYRGRVTTPDDLDILVTAKNHDVKQAVALGCGLDDWIVALIDLQTMAGFLGAGNYGVARMNGGFSARPCLGLAPADGGLGAHLFHDLQRMLAGRASLLDSYPDYFDPEHGVTLLWLEPWDGTTALDLGSLVTLHWHSGKSSEGLSYVVLSEAVLPKRAVILERGVGYVQQDASTEDES